MVMTENIDPIKIIEYFYPQDSALRRLLILHSSQVCRKALEIAAASGIELDLEIVKNGSMLHDIGIGHCHAPGIFCEGDAHYIEHGTLGAQMLRHYGAEHNLDLEVYALICERHTGSGITADEVAAQKLPLSVRDYLPLTREEKLVALADKFFSKSGDQQEKPFDKVRKSMAKFGDASLARFDELCKLFGVNNE
jgi:uncharacterized protein